MLVCRERQEMPVHAFFFCLLPNAYLRVYWKKQQQQLCFLEWNDSWQAEICEKNQGGVIKGNEGSVLGLDSCCVTHCWVWTCHIQLFLIDINENDTQFCCFVCFFAAEFQKFPGWICTQSILEMFIKHAHKMPFCLRISIKYFGLFLCRHIASSFQVRQTTRSSVIQWLRPWNVTLGQRKVTRMWWRHPEQSLPGNDTSHLIGLLCLASWDQLTPWEVQIITFSKKKPKPRSQHHRDGKWWRRHDSELQLRVRRKSSVSSSFVFLLLVVSFVLLSLFCSFALFIEKFANLNHLCHLQSPVDLISLYRECLNLIPLLKTQGLP